MCQAIASWFASLDRSEWFDFVSTGVGAIALVAAIAIAIFEHARAVRASQDRASDFRRTVRALVETLDAKAQEVEVHAADGETERPWSEWVSLADDVTAGLEAVLPSSPPLPEIIVAVAAMIRRLKQSSRFRGMAFEPAMHIEHVRSVRRDLSAQLDKIR